MRTATMAALAFGFAACRSPWPAVDPAASGVTELTAADRAFAAASARRGADAWAEAWATAGRKEAQDGPDAVGPEAVRSSMAPVLGRYGARFRWEPEHAAMLWPDTLGYTTGRWWIDDGPGRPAGGRYLTVWIREAGTWKVALDASAPLCDASPGARAFDFWQGEWRIAQRLREDSGETERYPARSSVARVAGACALAESWSGVVRYPWAAMERPRAIRGASIRIYDPARERWSIYWIDTVSGRFGPPFRGGFEGGVGEFLMQPPDSGGFPRRIRFRPTSPRIVAWELAVRQNGAMGEWVPLWMMRFERR